MVINTEKMLAELKVGNVIIPREKWQEYHDNLSYMLAVCEDNYVLRHEAPIIREMLDKYPRNA